MHQVSWKIVVAKSWYRKQSSHIFGIDGLVEDEMVMRNMCRPPRSWQRCVCKITSRCLTLKAYATMRSWSWPTLQSTSVIPPVPNKTVSECILISLLAYDFLWPISLAVCLQSYLNPRMVCRHIELLGIAQKGKLEISRLSLYFSIQKRPRAPILHYIFWMLISNLETCDSLKSQKICNTRWSSK